MRVYVAGPMRGHPDLNFPAFNEASMRLRMEGHVVFNPAENSPADADMRQCMAIDTAWICSSAEAVALLPGWEKSLGARAERALADALGLEIIYLQQ